MIMYVYASTISLWMCINWCASVMHTCTVTPEMNLLPSASSDKAWVYKVNADFADEEAKVEQLAIRFKNPESKGFITKLSRG